MNWSIVDFSVPKKRLKAVDEVPVKRGTVEVCWRTVTVIANAVPEIDKARFMNAFPKAILDLWTRTFSEM